MFIGRGHPLFQIKQGKGDYMKGKTKSRNSILMRLTLLIMSVIMAFSVALMAACSTTPSNDDDDDDSSTEEEVTETDEQLIKNGNFNFLYDTSDSLDYPRTPKSWSYSFDGSGDTKAPSSSSDALYGVLNVTDKFDEINKVEEGKDPKFGTIADKSQPIENPKSPNGADEKGRDNVLMLYNKNDTAIRYKSPSITIAPNSYIEISLWVKTVGIEKGGAHINITSGVEEPIYLKNINTGGYTDDAHNDYKQYTFLFVGDALQSKTIYLELGLGYGDQDNQREQQRGYAFFDDITMKHLSMKEFIMRGTALETSGQLIMFQANGEPFDENIYDKNDKTAVAYTFDTSWDTAFDSITAWTAFNNVENKAIDANAKFEKSFVVSDKFSSLTDEQKKLLENYPFIDDYKVSLLQNVNKTSTLLKSNNFTLQASKYYRISFWIKTTEFAENTGFSMYLTNGKDKNQANNPVGGEIAYKSYGSLTNLSTPRDDKDLEDEDVTKEYKQENWQQVNLLVETGYYQAENVALEFYIGPQYVDTETNGDQYKWDLIKGSVFFTDPMINEMTKNSYSSASTGTYASKISVSTSSTPTTTITNGGFSTPITSLGTPDYSGNPLEPSDWLSFPYSHKQMGGEGVAPADIEGITSGITNRLYGTNDQLPAGNPTSLVINADTTKTPTAFGYTTAFKTMSANSVYRISVDVMANTKFGIYLVDKDGKVLSDANYKAKVLTDEEKKELGDDKPTDYHRFEENGNRTMFFEDDFTSKSNISNDGTTWKTYYFYVKTLSEAKDFRIEIWLGNKLSANSEGTGKTTGTVYFDNVQMTSSATTLFDKEVKRQVEAGNMTEVDNTNKETVVENSKDMFFKGSNIIVSNYTKANPTPPEEKTEDDNDDEEEPTPFNWGILLTGIATLLMAAALIYVLIIKLFKKTKKHIVSKESKIKNKPQTKYDKTLNRAGTVKSDDNNDNNDDDDDDDEDDEEPSEDEDEDESEDVSEDDEVETTDSDVEEDDDIELDVTPSTALDDEDDEQK